jgi:nucleoside-diphosphate-sugar epimerase
VLLKRGLKVRGATRSAEKGKAMLEARPKFASQLDFVQIQDFEKTGVFEGAVKDVDAVIHVASVCFIPKIKETPSFDTLLLIIFAAIYL